MGKSRLRPGLCLFYHPKPYCQLKVSLATVSPKLALWVTRLVISRLLVMCYPKPFFPFL